jgi:hypothetical protein
VDAQHHDTNFAMNLRESLAGRDPGSLAHPNIHDARVRPEPVNHSDHLALVGGP